MNYEDIPEYDRIESWFNAEGLMEMKLVSEDAFVGDNGKVEMHLVEDDRDVDRIEDGVFYTWEGQSKALEFVRERRAFDMRNGIVDADYVVLSDDGERTEHQHNHDHLDNDVRRGRRVPMRVHTA
jgi:hypothetical protein